MVAVSILRGESLVAQMTVHSLRFALLLCFHFGFLRKNLLLKHFGGYWRHFCDFPLEVITMPVSLVVATLYVAVRKRHATCYTSKQGHFTDIYVSKGRILFFVRASLKLGLGYPSSSFRKVGNANNPTTLPSPLSQTWRNVLCCLRNSQRLLGNHTTICTVSGIIRHGGDFEEQR